MASHTIQPMKDFSVGISVDLESLCKFNGGLVEDAAGL